MSAMSIQPGYQNRRFVRRQDEKQEHYSPRPSCPHRELALQFLYYKAKQIYYRYENDGSIFDIDAVVINKDDTISIERLSGNHVVADTWKWQEKDEIEDENPFSWQLIETHEVED